MHTNQNWRPLTAAEARIIEDKGTEPPFSGQYNTHSVAGVYTCRRCRAALYRSTDKFDAGCGWPAFDNQVPGAIKRQPDADGRRTEILCATCEAHLGHVFSNEGLTPRNLRHCVNSLALAFIPQAALPTTFARATFAGGCFWGVEYFMQQAHGVISAISGYTGGSDTAPTYAAVCTGSTGHYEAVEVLFDPQQTSYQALAKLFFNTHNPAQADGQGPDIGPQYRSAIFFHDTTQRAIAQNLIEQLLAKGITVTTVLLPATAFYTAEAHHQAYYLRHNSRPYCHIFTERF